MSAIVNAPKEKVVLAYSGGLDTSVSISWIKQNYNMDVVAVLVDCGQPDSLDEAYERAIAAGASKAMIIDAREDFVYNYIFPSIKANLKYEKSYPLATALARPLIVEKLVEVARKEEAKAVAHGCTAKGNDQVRFDVGIRSLNPDLRIIAPLREWKLSREEEIEYAREHKIPVKVSKKSPYSIDENLWGRSIECGVLEDPWEEPPEEIYTWTSIRREKNETLILEIEFEKGVPVAINGEKLAGVELIKRLNQIAGSFGIGRIDMVENRLIGIKSREIYEAPAAVVLIEAHRQLESMVMDRELLHYKYLVEEKLAELTYYGLWFTPLRSCISSFIEKSQEYVTGKVKVKLEYKAFSVIGRESCYSLYDLKLATYDKQDIFDPRYSESFIRIWGFPYEILARKGRMLEER
ncbi:MAG: argininosuccinate synthase [Actinobacteria bacterium]|nr:argininosuccinate synthase [Actinomycetota bacterium]